MKDTLNIIGAALLKLIIDTYTFIVESMTKKEVPMPPEIPYGPIAPAKDAAVELLELAESFQNTDPSPTDPVDDVLGCVDSLTEIIRKKYPDFPKSYFTGTLLQDLKDSPHFKGTLVITEGAIIINATGTGNNSIRGHCGVIGKDGWIWANNSDTGLWTRDYTLTSWRKRYRIKGGMPTYIFLPL